MGVVDIHVCEYVWFKTGVRARAIKDWSIKTNSFGNSDVIEG